MSAPATRFCSSRRALRLVPALALALAALPVPLLRAQVGPDVLQFLASTGTDPDATALARWTEDADFTVFSVELAHMPVGSYDLDVGGVNVGVINVTAVGQGQILFVTPPTGTDPTFDFEVFDQTIEVSQGTVIFFTDTFHNSGSGPGTTPVDDFSIALMPVADDFGVHGTMHFVDGNDGTTLGLEMTGLPAATHDISVGGTVVGHLVSTGTLGESVTLDFSDPGTPGSLPLDFDPLGAFVTIGPPGQPLLGAVMPASSATSGVAVPADAKQQFKNVGKAKGDALQVQLANTGAVVGAQASGTLTQDAAGEELVLQAQGLPTGTSFDVFVDGTLRGTLVPDAKGKATLVFQSPLVDGDLLLDFPVKGKLLEIRSGATVALAAFWPPSVQAALGTFVHEKHGPKSVKVNLFNVGSDLDATGTASWQQKPNGNEALVVKVKDLPAGSFDVVVDGVAQGDAALVVKKADGSAKVRFATVPGAKDLPLDFAVAGTTLTITPDADNATVLMQVVVQ